MRYWVLGCSLLLAGSTWATTNSGVDKRSPAQQQGGSSTIQIYDLNDPGATQNKSTKKKKKQLKAIEGPAEPDPGYTYQPANPTGRQESPEESGRPDGVGKPDGVGRPDGVGKPDGVGRPDDVGRPDNPGRPEVPRGLLRCLPGRLAPW